MRLCMEVKCYALVHHIVNQCWIIILCCLLNLPACVWSRAAASVFVMCMMVCVVHQYPLPNCLGVNTIVPRERKLKEIIIIITMIYLCGLRLSSKVIGPYSLTNPQATAFVHSWTFQVGKEILIFDCYWSVNRFLCTSVPLLVAVCLSLCLSVCLSVLSCLHQSQGSL